MKTLSNNEGKKNEVKNRDTTTLAGMLTIPLNK
jgi:hypothetical protein